MRRPLPAHGFVGFSLSPPTRRADVPATLSVLRQMISAGSCSGVFSENAFQVSISAL
jgi:hypothetical protein